MFQRLKPWMGPATVLLALAVVFAVPAPAAALPTEGQLNFETRFVLYAVEDLFLDTWPQCNTDKPEDVDPSTIGDARAVRGFVAQRERLVHDLIDRVKELGLGDTHRDDLIDMLDRYVKFVRERGGQYAKDLDACLEDQMQKLKDRLAQVDKELAAKWADEAANPNNQVELTVTSDDPSTIFAVGFGAILASELGRQAERQAALNKALADWRDYWKDEGRDEYLKQVRKHSPKFLEDVKADRDARIETLKGWVNDLADKYHWTAKETAFQPVDTPDDRPQDPFLLIRTTLARPVDRAKGDTAQADDRLDRAKKFMKAGALVPSARNKAYDNFRARAYELAGVEAVRAAALTAGPNGFSGDKGGAGAVLALKAWTNFSENSKDLDLTGGDLYYKALSLAYSGRAIDAYALLKPHPQFYPSSPTFYYDLARICSAASEELLKLPPARQAKEIKDLSPNAFFLPQPRAVASLMLQDSSLALQQAVLIGFNDLDRAKTVRDLKAFREAGQEDLGYRLTFNQIVGGP